MPSGIKGGRNGSAHEPAAGPDTLSSRSQSRGASGTGFCLWRHRCPAQTAGKRGRGGVGGGICRPVGISGCRAFPRRGGRVKRAAQSAFFISFPYSRTPLHKINRKRRFISLDLTLLPIDILRSGHKILMVQRIRKSALRVHIQRVFQKGDNTKWKRFCVCPSPWRQVCWCPV